MRSRILLVGRRTNILVILAAGLVGCAQGSDLSRGSSAGSDGDTSIGGSPGGGNQGGEGPSSGTPGAGQGGSAQGGSAQGGAGQGGSAQGGAGQGGQGQGGAGQGGSAQGGAGQGGQGQGGNVYGQGIFEAPNPWTKNVADLEKSSESDAIIGWLDQNGGWGAGKMKIDFGIEVLEADSSTPKMSFTPTGDFFSPDCDEVPIPIPQGGAIEAENGYACVGDGDCHLLVVQKDEKKLYEMWRANIAAGIFFGGCAAVWDLTKTYPDNLRGEGCTSADAGGFPIAAMLFSVAEVQAGSIDHAIRFILPNQRIRQMTYVHPGSHSTFSTSGGANAPPYGVRFRLRKDFPLASLPSDGARVIAKAMQTYGMFLADGGNIALTAQSDRFFPVKWSDVNVDALSLSSIQVTDMEVVDMGAPIVWSTDCVRN